MTQIYFFWSNIRYQRYRLIHKARQIDSRTSAIINVSRSLYSKIGPKNCLCNKGLKDIKCPRKYSLAFNGSPEVPCFTKHLLQGIGIYIGLLKPA